MNIKKTIIFTLIFATVTTLFGCNSIVQSTSLSDKNAIFQVSDICE